MKEFKVEIPEGYEIDKEVSIQYCRGSRAFFLNTMNN